MADGIICIYICFVVVLLVVVLVCALSSFRNVGVSEIVHGWRTHVWADGSEAGNMRSYTQGHLGIISTEFGSHTIHVYPPTCKGPIHHTHIGIATHTHTVIYCSLVWHIFLEFFFWGLFQGARWNYHWLSFVFVFRFLYEVVFNICCLESYIVQTTYSQYRLINGTKTSTKLIHCRLPRTTLKTLRTWIRQWMKMSS